MLLMVREGGSTTGSPLVQFCFLHSTPSCKDLVEIGTHVQAATAGKSSTTETKAEGNDMAIDTGADTDTDTEANFSV